MSTKKIVLSILSAIISIILSVALCYFFLDAFLMIIFRIGWVPYVLFRMALALFIYIVIDYAWIHLYTNKTRIRLFYIAYLLGLASCLFKYTNMHAYNFHLFQFRYALMMNGQKALLLGNICVFIPVGFVVCYHYPKVKTLLIALLCIIGVEILQYITCLGVFDIDDIMLNFIGIFIGYMICKIYRKKVVMK